MGEVVRAQILAPGFRPSLNKVEPNIPHPRRRRSPWGAALSGWAKKAAWPNTVLLMESPPVMEATGVRQ
jgi:hypothetical protein